MDFISKILGLLGLRNKSVQKFIPNVVQSEIPPVSNEVLLPVAPREVTQLEYPLLTRATSSSIPVYNEVARNDKGVLEDFFFDYVSRVFPDTVKNNIGTAGFTPDLAIIDRDKDLFIAVEIDEPYSIGSSGTLIPIHTIGSDDARNKQFAASGWTIIRFAEEQIANQPEQCVKIIKHFADNRELLNLNPVKCWTKNEAQLMIEANPPHRDTYLPFAFRGVALDKNRSYASYRSFKITGISKREKSGKEYVQIRLEYPRVTTDEVEITKSGNHPEHCWVDQEVFWSKVYASKSGKMFGKMINDFDLQNNIGLYFNSKCGPIMLECYGKQNGAFFNVVDNKFDIVFSSEFLGNTKKWYLEIINNARAQYGLPKLS